MGKKIKNPIGHSVEAKPHTPVYRMHRYFARRPYSVFRELVNHYTEEGEIVLDPFCGGGVTVVEGLRLKRKVVGVDLNPMAPFITKTECMPIDLDIFKQTFNTIVVKVEKEIEQLYDTLCPKCKKPVSFNWVEWSHVYECPSCKKDVVIAECKKKGSGKYECNHCKNNFVVTNTKRFDDKLTRIMVKCDNCKYKGIESPEESDINKTKRIQTNFSQYIKSKGLWYPEDEMPMDYDLRRPYNYRMKKFVDFLTKRNLIALAILFKEIRDIKDDSMRYIMLNVFTSTLSWVTKLCVDPGHGWPISAYWVADVHYELNVWKQFTNRFSWFLRGKEYSNKEIGGFFKEAKSFDQLENDSTALLLTLSSTKLPLSDNSVDAVITDPPYGANVMYSELCNFSIIWLREFFKIKGLMDSKEEAIINEYQEKDCSTYENLLYGVFKECHRVLKPGKWMVMTFNNKESSVWMALLRAARRAGFYLPEEGIIYQEPIKHYTNTLYQRREGSVLGDFIYSFQKVSEKENHGDSSKNGDIHKLVDSVATKIIRNNGGATTSEIFQHIVPKLFNSNLIAEEKDMIPDIEDVLRKEFKLEKVGDIKKWVSNKQEALR